MKPRLEDSSAQTMALLGRGLGLSILILTWLLGPGGPEGLVTILLLAILGLGRWRFARLPPWTLLVDQAVCGLAIMAWPEASLGLALPILEAATLGLPWLALPSLVLVSALGLWTLPLALGLAWAGFSGWILHLWRRGLDKALLDADRDRRERYDLEGLRDELLSANIRAARMAQLAERARIARDLHDHLGHELTAAHLALQAYSRLREGGDPRAQDMLDQGQGRLGSGLELLRSTVQGLAPNQAEGLESLQEVCRRFAACPASLEVHGDSGRIPVHGWAVLEPCLKEGLTNAARHGSGEGIAVSLDLGPRIARLSIRSALGPASLAPGPRTGGREGQGLANLRRRAMAIGGNVSVDLSRGFCLVCVIPLEDSL